MTRPLLAAAGMTLALLAVVLSTLGTTGVQADPGDEAGDTKEIDEKLRNPDDPASLLVGEQPSGLRSFNAQAVAEAEVGDQADWVALHDTGGFFYLKTFELRASNGGGQVWIAVGEGSDANGDPDGIEGLDFPDGDCRNDGIRNVVTDGQADYLLNEFTSNIEPIDEQWFGEPNFRDGTNAALGPGYESPAGKQVALIDNVRDDNFYDTDNSQTLPYIAGFFTTAMGFFHDRNVMSIDGFDWPHRTGANPPHEPSADPCTSAVARPFLYEGVFAHEYQHLIHADYDPDEVNWVNEGMSDLAIILTGYGDPSVHIDEKGSDSHIQNFLGWASVEHPEWNPIPRPSGPENSLTVWEDQGPGEILADYGIAYYVMLYLLDHGYDQQFFTDWHHNELNGIAGLDDALASAGRGDTFESVFRNVSISALVDGYIDRGGNAGAEENEALQSDSLNATIFFSDEAYATPGAPPWGSDYLPLGPGKKLNKLEFNGDDQLTFPGGNDWTVDGDGYWTNPDEADGDYGPDVDTSIAREVSVPAGAATLTFEHWYQLELGWDFGFVQVLDDGDYVSLPCTGTTSDHNPEAKATIADEVPGYTGPSDNPANPATTGTAAAPLAVECDLSAYAGETVVLAFRLMTDPLAHFDGWHLRDVAINGTPVDSTPNDLSDWDNQAFFRPLALNFMLTLVGITGRVDEYGHVERARKIVVVRTELDEGSTYELTKEHRKALRATEQVYAIVSGVPEEESNAAYLPYSLEMKKKELADGAGIP